MKYNTEVKMSQLQPNLKTWINFTHKKNIETKMVNMLYTIIYKFQSSYIILQCYKLGDWVS